MSILEKTPGLHKSAYRTRRSTLRRRTAEDTQKFPSPHAMCAEKRHVCFGPIADIGPTSDENSDAWQDKPDLGELARLCIDLN